MRRLRLKGISIEKQMTVFLPITMSLLLLIGTLTVNRLRETAPADAGEGKTISEEQPLPITEPIRVLFILHEKETAFFSVLDIQPTGTVTVTPITDDSAVRIYENEGADVLRHSMQATYYADITFEGLRQMLQYYGDGGMVTLSSPLEYTDDAGLSVAFPAGKLRLSANQLLDLLRALANAADSADTVAALHTDLLDRYVNETRISADIYAVFAEYADTDIRIYDFEKHLPLIEALAARTPVAEAAEQ